jgi:hypothetical protein
MQRDQKDPAVPVRQLAAMPVDGLMPCIQFTVDRTSLGFRSLLWIDASAPPPWLRADEVWLTVDGGAGSVLVRWELAFEAFNRRAFRVAESLPGPPSRAQLPPGAVLLG